MYNKIILIGNLTRDPELKYSPQGTPVTSFRIVVNSRLSEENQETLFIDVIAFGRGIAHKLRNMHLLRKN